MDRLVVGVGNPRRGDDGAGPAVAGRVAELAIPGVRVIIEDEPLGLLEHFATYDEVVVVDAVKPNGHPGGVQTWVVGPEPVPRCARPVGSHSLGVGEVIELARALGQLPRRMVLVGVEAQSFRTGAALTLQVADQLDDAVRAVVASLPPAQERRPASQSPGSAGRSATRT